MRTLQRCECGIRRPTVDLIASPCHVACVCVVSIRQARPRQPTHCKHDQHPHPLNPTSQHPECCDIGVPNCDAAPMGSATYQTTAHTQSYAIRSTSSQQGSSPHLLIVHGSQPIVNMTSTPTRRTPLFQHPECCDIGMPNCDAVPMGSVTYQTIAHTQRHAIRSTSSHQGSLPHLLIAHGRQHIKTLPAPPPTEPHLSSAQSAATSVCLIAMRCP